MGSRSTGGATIKKQRWTGLPSIESNSTPLVERAKRTARSVTMVERACGTAIPLPRPVLPRASLCQHIQNRLRLTRDPVLGEMSDHLLEDGGFLSGSQLGNEERGAEV